MARRRRKRGPLSPAHKKKISRALKKKFGTLGKAVSGGKKRRRKKKGKLDGDKASLLGAGAILLTGGGLTAASALAGEGLYNKRTRKASLELLRRASRSAGAGAAVGAVGLAEGAVEGGVMLGREQASKLPGAAKQGVENFKEELSGPTTPEQKASKEYQTGQEIAKKLKNNPVTEAGRKTREATDAAVAQVKEDYNIPKQAQKAKENFQEEISKKEVVYNPDSKAGKAGRLTARVVGRGKKDWQKTRQFFGFSQADNSNTLQFNTLADMQKWLSETDYIEYQNYRNRLREQNYLEFAAKKRSSKRSKRSKRGNRKPLSAAHKKKISMALKNKNRTGDSRKPIDPSLIEASTQGVARLARAGATVNNALLQRRKVERDLGLGEVYRGLGAASNTAKTIGSFRPRNSTITHQVMRLGDNWGNNYPSK